MPDVLTIQIAILSVTELLELYVFIIYGRNFLNALKNRASARKKLGWGFLTTVVGIYIIFTIIIAYYLYAHL